MRSSEDVIIIECISYLLLFTFKPLFSFLCQILQKLSPLLPIINHPLGFINLLNTVNGQ